MGPSLCLTCRITEKDPRQGSSLSAWMGRATEGLAKEAFWSLATRGTKKDSDRVITPAVEAVCVSAHLAQPGSPQAKQLCQLHVQLSLGRAATGNSLPSVHLGSLWQCLRRYRLWPARLLCQGEGFSGQEYWHVLANTGCHTFLECYISCCPTCQLPWVPGAARTPAIQAAAPPPHLALTGANPSPPGQP